jgi:DNA primase
MFNISSYIRGKVSVSKENEVSIALVACPWCGIPQNHRASFFISKAKPMFHCFRCNQSGSYARLVSKLDRMPLVKAKELVGDIDPVVIYHKEEEIVPIPLPPEGCWTLGALGYLESRGIDREMRKHFGLYYCRKGREHHRVIIPISDDGKVVTYQARTVTDHWLRYYSPPESPTDRVVYNLDRWDGESDVYLVEGVFDVFKCAVNGFFAVSCLGKSVSKVQIRKILEKGVKSLTLAFDYDTIPYIQNLFYEIGYAIPLKLVGMDQKNRDPGELSFQDAQEILGSRYSNPSEMKMARLRKFVGGLNK